MSFATKMKMKTKKCSITPFKKYFFTKFATDNRHMGYIIRST